MSNAIPIGGVTRASTPIETIFESIFGFHNGIPGRGARNDNIFGF